MARGFDLDHTSFAVADALAWARRLRRELGAVPIAGETLPEFRYLLLYVGTADAGARIELLEPVGGGFLSRFLETRGEGPHHLTVTVPDLADAVRRVRAIGLDVVGENHAHPPWREAFLAPDAVHGTLIQLAQSDRSYPSPGDLLGTRDRDPDALPSSQGATDPLWWTSFWDTEPSSHARLGETRLGSTDLDTTRRLFVDALGARPSEADGTLRLTWPSGSVHVHAVDEPGIRGMALDGAPAQGLTIGTARLAPWPDVPHDHRNEGEGR